MKVPKIVERGLFRFHIAKYLPFINFDPVEVTILEALEKIAEKEGLEDEVKRIRGAREVLKKWVEQK